MDYVGLLAESNMSGNDTDTTENEVLPTDIIGEEEDFDLDEEVDELDESDDFEDLDEEDEDELDESESIDGQEDAFDAIDGEDLDKVTKEVTITAESRRRKRADRMIAEALQLTRSKAQRKSKVRTRR